MPAPQPSQKPILQKLLLKPGQRAVFLNPPDSYRAVIEAAPADVEVAQGLNGQFDFIQAFVTKQDEVRGLAPQLKAALKPQALLWVSYPKGKSVATDLNRDLLAAAMREAGFQPVAMVAVDDVWSAMRFKVL